MDIQGLKVWSCGDNIVDMVDMDDLDDLDNLDDLDDLDEESSAVSSSSAADTAFDAVIGCIEDIIMEEEFQQLQQSFMEKHYQEFDDSEENKLSYTPIFNDYVDLLENHLEQQLMAKIPGFKMNTFIELLMQHKEEVPGDIFDIMLTFTDFMAFKELFLFYKAEKEGRGLDSGQEFLVTSLIPAGSKLNSSTELQ
ncbi:ADP-ribosylation factor-like protein 2-binding protein isoform X2 [Notolabrus celidotus]|uniref:ADP-ribosylation factor-like protein 2-binding protein isoform X1 n=1 Tax=Notolabrus celidotus TaxID=1203425 RepID=UPI00148FE032|nr:ADP-ribosylation factor-like protein 2-binding protein isoform X1 [Notolabrus celidotus]XP_034542558.1 ADP-ribosylation factor-like protein 2-binding protein isoform X2 [Notolabrus celidotus]